MGRQDYETETMVAHALPISFEANMSFQAPDQTGCHPTLTRRTHASVALPIAFSGKDYGADAGDISPTLRSMAHDGSHANGGGQVAVAFSIMPMNSGKDYKARETDVAQPLMAGGPTGGNQGGDFVAQSAVAFDMRGRDGGAQFEGPHDTANIRAATGGSSRSYVASWAVRRLTPTECERLQGFPDNYTQVPHRKKPAADGPRYKALGNSMAVNVMQWIGERIKLVEEQL
jgi:DNA (cytosine-5)-methyltransferase 1